MPNIWWVQLLRCEDLRLCLCHKYHYIFLIILRFGWMKQTLRRRPFSVLSTFTFKNTSLYRCWRAACMMGQWETGVSAGGNDSGVEWWAGGCGSQVTAIGGNILRASGRQVENGWSGQFLWNARACRWRWAVAAGWDRLSNIKTTEEVWTLFF